ncbi:hypothetical protein MMC25_008093 [Agyrium rufum]|nr:hypothetical protein [Agyrium rufum]
MVSLSAMRASNARATSALPRNLVAVFVGATSGIGETSLKQFAKHTLAPRIYFVGRNQTAGERITKECKALNAEGSYTFMKADVSLLKSVDDVCREIRAKEKTINLLFMTMGTMVQNVETSEDLHFAAALIYYGRNRFIANLLPLLQTATSLRRVVSVFTGTKEGPIDMSNIQLRAAKTSLLKLRGHGASLVTTSLETFAKRAPDVSFVHGFPGHVKTNIQRDTTGAIFAIIKVVSAVFGLFTSIPFEECGERHVFLATSAKYPSRSNADAVSMVGLTDGVEVARGTDGKVGSGVYSVDQHGESASEEVVKVLEGLRKEGVPEKIWEDTQKEFLRITGTEAI